MAISLHEQKSVWELIPGEKASVVVATPEQATQEIVLLVHGFMSNKDSETNLLLTRCLLQKGIATIRLDLFGHGESEGQLKELTLSRCLHQIDGVMKWIKDNGYLRVSIVGSSFGGLIAIHTAGKYPDLYRLALKCPVSDYPTIWRSRLGKEGMSRWKEEGLLTFMTEDGKAQLSYGYYEDLLRYDTPTVAARILTPTLVVHGDADFDVPVDQSLRFFDTLRLPNDQKRLVMIPGADHAFSKPDDFLKMIDVVDAWLTATP